jgi:hypothetical protein
MNSEIIHRAIDALWDTIIWRRRVNSGDFRRKRSGETMSRAEYNVNRGF